MRFNEIRLSQLTRAAAEKYDTNRLENVLCDFDFLAAKCAAGMTTDLLNDFLIARRTPRCSKRLQEYSQFISRNVNTYESHPQMIIQDALNMPRNSVVYTDAMKTKVSPTPWLEDTGSRVILKNPAVQDLHVFTLHAHSAEVTSLVFLPQVCCFPFSLDHKCKFRFACGHSWL